MSNILELTPQLHQYIINNSVSEPQALTELRKVTAKLPESGMVTLADQGQFIYFLLRLMQAKRVIEIGTFTGCGTFAIALALPENGEVITLDSTEKFPNIGKPYWEQGNVAGKIQLKVGKAITSLQALLDLGEQEQFDAMFIDADKEHNEDYYEFGLQLIRPGGLIMVDNTLWSGRVSDESNQEASTNHIRKFNQKLHHDPRIDFSLVTIADGMALARKR